MIIDVLLKNKIEDRLKDIHNDFLVRNQMYCLMAMKRSGIITDDDFTNNMNNIAKRLKIDFKEIKDDGF